MSEVNKAPELEEPLLEVGDYIEFDHFGQILRGRITTVGKYGYWINSGSMYHGSARCDFGKATKIG